MNKFHLPGLSCLILFGSLMSAFLIWPPLSVASAADAGSTAHDQCCNDSAGAVQGASWIAPQVYSETFDLGMGGWQNWGDGWGAGLQAAVDGTFGSPAPSLHLPGDDTSVGGGLVYLQDYVFGNGVIDLDVYLPGPNAVLDLLFRATLGPPEGHTGYLARFDSRTPAYPDTFVKIDDWTYIGERSGHFSTVEQWHHWKLEAYGASLTLYNDGQKVAWATVPARAAGQIAILNEVGQAYIDNVYITPTLSAAQFNTSAYSGWENAGTIPLTVTLDMEAPVTVTVEYATQDGTAVAGQDYMTATGTLVFPPYVTEQTFGVSLIDNALDAPDTSLTVRLAMPNHAELGAPHTATLTILDDEFVVTGELSVNGGALNSTALNVVLSCPSLSGVASMSFSNDGVVWSAWQPYTSTTRWSLAAGDGLKTVYARFGDERGSVSLPVSDTIELDTSVDSEYGMSINRGALFTNRTAVELTLGARAGTAHMQISNDGGFSGAVWEPYASHKSWMITQHGSYVIPRTVYARYKDVAGQVWGTFQDDIILDVTPPTGTVALPPIGSVISPQRPMHADHRTLSLPVTLTLTATDDLSGVEYMQISHWSDFAGAVWEPYATRRDWILIRSTVYARFQDRAGNVSPAYSATTPAEILDGMKLFLPLVAR